MKALALALYAEGSTDRYFLPSIIRRTSRLILDRHGQSRLEVRPVDLIEINKVGISQNECILQAAQKAIENHMLIVHCDADHPTPEKALKERFLPGYELVQQAQEQICKSLVPIIPIQATEAWMLAADHDLLRREIGTNKSARDLGLVSRARQVESDPDPKQTLKEIIRKANEERSRRRREVDLRLLYAPLGREISLERLGNVPSYKQFMKDLTETLKILNLIQTT